MGELSLTGTAKDALDGLISNKAIWIPLIAWATAQFLKVVVNYIRERKLSWSLIVSQGGMPSSHTALMTSLATVIAVLYGLDSPLFALAMVTAFIVMYDAAGVRRTVGYQSTVVNKIVDELFKDNPEFGHRLQEIIGHSRWQVFFGAILGVSFGLFLTWLWQ